MRIYVFKTKEELVTSYLEMHEPLNRITKALRLRHPNLKYMVLTDVFPIKSFNPFFKSFRVWARLVLAGLEMNDTAGFAKEEN